MKIKNLLLAGLVVLGMTACSNNDEPTPDNGGKYDTYLQLSIQSPQMGTRTSGTPSDPVSEGDESKITSVRVYLTDAAGNIRADYSPSITGGKTEVFEVIDGDEYYVFAVVNPTATLHNTGNIQRVIEGVTQDQAKGGYNDGSFMMVNETNLPKDDASFTNVALGLGGKFVKTTGTTEAAPATATINVDRLAIKVKDISTTVSVDPVKDADKKAFMTGLDITGMVLINGNTQTNLIQEWLKPTTGDITGLHLSTPNDKKNYYNYIYNFAKKEDLEDLTVTMTESPFLAKNATVYALENRSEFQFTGKGVLTAGQNSTTGLIYRMKIAGKNTFFRYGGAIYLQDADATGGEKSFKDLKALYEFTNTDGSSKIEGFDTDRTKFPELRKLGIKVYENAVMYYTHFIRGTQDQNKVTNNHTAYTETNKEVVYYGVLRNSWYSMNVKSVSDFGDDIPGGGGTDPEVVDPPIDTDKAYLEVEVKVNPWVLNKIDIDF